MQDSPNMLLQAQLVLLGTSDVNMTVRLCSDKKNCQILVGQ